MYVFKLLDYSPGTKESELLGELELSPAEEADYDAIIAKAHAKFPGVKNILVSAKPKLAFNVPHKFNRGTFNGPILPSEYHHSLAWDTRLY